jgi:hypothetical protein
MPSLGDIVNTITIRGVVDGVDATTVATKGLKDACRRLPRVVQGIFPGHSILCRSRSAPQRHDVVK